MSLKLGLFNQQKASLAEKYSSMYHSCVQMPKSVCEQTEGLQFTPSTQYQNQTYLDHLKQPKHNVPI